MRFVHLSDIHLDEHRRIAGAKRLTAGGAPYALANAAACVRNIMALGQERGRPDGWLVTGDLFDRPTPTPLEERTAIELVAEMAAIAPVIVLAGNHDVPGIAAEATALECLKRRPGVHVIERPTVLAFVPPDYNDTGPRGHSCAVVGVGQAGARGVRAMVACLPYPRRAEVGTGLDLALSAEERNAIISEGLRKLVIQLRNAGAELGHVPKVLCYHGSIGGARVRQQPRSLASDIVLDSSDLAGWTYVACGHIHERQEMAPGVWYAGSVDRVDFGEEADAKSGTLVTIDPVTCAVASMVTLPTPAIPFVTLAPDALNVAALASETAYRVQGEMPASDAKPVRQKIAEAQDRGIWIVDALTATSEARVRDALATSDDSPVDFLRRWILARPEPEALARVYGGTVDGIVEEVVALAERVDNE